MAVSRFAEVQQLEAEVADLTERLETRKAVDRAKGVLQAQLQLSEPEAFRWIQKTAMDLRLSMRQVADGVVQHGPGLRSEEHTSELQSRQISYAVFCLKKKTNTQPHK